MRALWYWLPLLLIVSYSHAGATPPTTGSKGKSPAAVLNIRHILGTLFDRERTGNLCKKYKNNGLLWQHAIGKKATKLDECLGGTKLSAAGSDNMKLVYRMEPICQQSQKFVACLKEVVESQRNRCNNVRGSAYGEAVLKIADVAVAALCTTELKRLGSMSDPRLQSCINDQYDSVQVCSKEFSDLVYRGQVDEEGILQIICKDIATFISCIQDSLGNCGISEVSESVEKVKWELATEMNCPNLYENNQLTHVHTQDTTPPHHYDKYDAVRIFEGDAESVYKDSVSYYMTHRFTRQYKDLWQDCKNGGSKKLLEEWRDEDLQSTYMCLYSILKQNLTEDQLDHHPVDSALVVSGLCRGPRKAFHCYEHAFDRLASCHHEDYTQLSAYAKNLLKEVLYVLCVAEKQSWEEIDVPVLNYCLVSQFDQVKECASEFIIKFLNTAKAKDVSEKDFCINSWELLECLEDTMTSCPLSQGQLTVQLRLIKLALVNRLGCAYPYNPEALADSATKILLRSLKDFDNLMRYQQGSLDSCNGKGECTEFQLYSTHKGFRNFTRAMDSNLRRARQQLLKLVETLDINPVKEFGGPLGKLFEENHIEFYRNMFQFCPGQNKEMKISYIDALANSTVSCLVERIVNASTENSYWSWSPSATLKGLCSGGSSSSIWDCISKPSGKIGHCYNKRARFLDYVGKKYHQTGSQIVCNNTNLLWEGTSESTVDTCIKEQWSHLRSCGIVFVDMFVKSCSDEHIKIQCYNVLQLLECVEDGIIKCGNPELAWNFARLKERIFLEMSCYRTGVEQQKLEDLDIDGENGIFDKTNEPLNRIKMV